MDDPLYPKNLPGVTIESLLDTANAETPEETFAERVERLAKETEAIYEDYSEDEIEEEPELPSPRTHMQIFGLQGVTGAWVELSESEVERRQDPYSSLRFNTSTTEPDLSAWEAETDVDLAEQGVSTRFVGESDRDAQNS